MAAGKIGFKLDFSSSNYFFCNRLGVNSAALFRLNGLFKIGLGNTHRIKLT